ncbi:MAG: cytochrome C oxidase subunit IV family protein [Acidimicrobiia bacterium]|nr:cytochrome C oxidase subunit IV family protein [Acidimicrobiia bacterium]MDX2466065.1 cytochrome C oxidase subunit IV family protein [Acidimicrobiia bacterium]
MAETAHRAHPTPAMYWGIAAFLAVVTAIEIAIPGISALDSVKVPLLWGLAIVKFGTVVMFFMHLRYEKKLYRTLFLLGVIGVVPLMLVMLLSMDAL